MKTTGNVYVDAVGSQPITGTVFPNSWFHKPEFRYESGSVNLLAMLIMADLLYWYRPREHRHEQTGHTMGWSKKFAADKLQRSYKDMAEFFGVSKKQATDACHFLEEAGFINLEHRTLTISGYPHSNITHINPTLEGLEVLF